MSTDIALQSSTGLIGGLNNTLTSDQEQHFRELATANNFLPRLALYGGSTSAVKSGQFPMNHWGLVEQKDEIIDLGKEVEIIPLAVRFKALSTNGEVLSYYNPSTDTFNKVKELSKVKDSGCMAGVEFLLWLTEHGKFCTYFCYNVSSKQEAGKIRALINAAGVLSSKFVPNKNEPKKSFQAPVCNKSSTPPASVPTAEQANSEVDKFVNAQDSVSAAASAEESAATDRVQ